ncbi:hypothetical protein [Dyadobacter helix]|nr:hypothetical protein [Dyadobacter sp. CECT 9275]
MEEQLKIKATDRDTQVLYENFLRVIQKTKDENIHECAWYPLHLSDFDSENEKILEVWGPAFKEASLRLIQDGYHVTELMSNYGYGRKYKEILICWSDEALKQAQETGYPFLKLPDAIIA